MVLWKNFFHTVSYILKVSFGQSYTKRYTNWWRNVVHSFDLVRLVSFTCWEREGVCGGVISFISNFIALEWSPDFRDSMEAPWIEFILQKISQYWTFKKSVFIQNLCISSIAEEALNSIGYVDNTAKSYQAQLYLKPTQCHPMLSKRLPVQCVFRTEFDT